MRQHLRADLTRRGVLALGASAAALLALPAVAQTGTGTDVFRGDQVYGDPNAPVTMVEYASLACSHCAEFELKILPDLKKDFIDNGQVKLVFRDFPLNGPGLRAHMLARCAGEKRFPALKDILFKTQGQWLNQNYEAQLQRIGAMAGISKAQFDACMADKALEDSLIESQLKASNGQFQVNSTPTFIINDDAVVRGANKDEIYAALEAAGAKRAGG